MGITPEQAKERVRRDIGWALEEIGNIDAEGDGEPTWVSVSQVAEGVWVLAVVGGSGWRAEASLHLGPITIVEEQP